MPSDFSMEDSKKLIQLIRLGTFVMEKMALNRERGSAETERFSKSLSLDPVLVPRNEGNQRGNVAYQRQGKPGEYYFHRPLN